MSSSPNLTRSSQKKRSTGRRSRSEGSTERRRKRAKRSTQTSRDTTSRKLTVLGVDQSLTATGLALYKTGRGVTWADCVKTSPKKMVLEERLATIVASVIAYAKSVDLTVIEGPAYSQPNAAIAMGMVAGVIRHALWVEQFPFVVVDPRTIKKFATGSGNAKKEMMLLECQQHFETNNHNIADAVFMAMYGHDNYYNLVEEE